MFWLTIAAAGPMPVSHIVRQGECLSGIAARYGFGSYQALYDDPANAELKRKRPNPHLLHPGDVVVIPDGQPKSVSLATGRSHRIVVSRPARTIRLTLADPDHLPLANVPCTLTVAGNTIDGVTDGKGLVEMNVPIDAEEGTLAAGRYHWPLRFAALNPLSETPDDGISGIQARLRNMGYHPGEIDGVLGPRTASALRAFQAREGLTAHGEPDGPTRARLLRRHGC